MVGGRIACEWSAAGSCVALTNPCLLLSVFPLTRKTSSQTAALVPVFVAVRQTRIGQNRQRQAYSSNNRETVYKDNMHHIINYE